MNVTVTPKQALTIVRALLLDKPDQWAADATGLSVRVVHQVGQQYGAPDRAKLEWSRDELEQKLAATSARLTPAPQPQRDDPVGQTLKRGRASSKARTRALADRIQGMLDDLTDRLVTEAAEEDEKRRRDEEKERARAEVAKLERQLADAKARLNGRKVAEKPATVPSASGDHDPREVREWARDNGVACPAKGRVPRAVVEAWREAQERGAA